MNSQNGGDYVTTGTGTTINTYDLRTMFSTCWQPNNYSGGSTTSNGLLMSGNGTTYSYFPNYNLTNAINGTTISIINETGCTQSIYVQKGAVQFGSTYVPLGSIFSVDNNAIYTFIFTGGSDYWVLTTNYFF